MPSESPREMEALMAEQAVVAWSMRCEREHRSYGWVWRSDKAVQISLFEGGKAVVNGVGETYADAWLDAAAKLRKLGSADDVETLPSGAKQSRLDERFDLLPPHAMQRLAQVRAAGAAKYGETNHEGIDAADHLNHALAHINRWQQGDKGEDHVGHALCRLTFWADALIREEMQ